MHHAKTAKMFDLYYSKEFQDMEIVLHHIKGSMSGTATPFNKSSTIIN